MTKYKTFFKCIALSTPLVGGLLTYQGNESFYRNVLMPMVTFIDPEIAHRAAIHLANLQVPHLNEVKKESLGIEVFGLSFNSPIGLAAGFDKQGEAVDGLFQWGFDFIEIGSVTPLPQPGNDKPRVFRLVKDCAIVNRYGFNSDGHNVVLQRLEKQLKNKKKNQIVGVNLGVNKESALNGQDAKDFVEGVRIFGELADYLVINVSSPNTPGLRQMQTKERLTNILSEVLKARNELKKRTPLLVKISPDETDDNLQSIVSVLCSQNCRVDGVIVSNTTVQFHQLKLQTEIQNINGGLSGKPLRDRSTETIKRVASLSHGQLPIIGCGGVFTGEDAWQKLQAGASLVQLYTALAYEGPPVVNKIKRELADIVALRGFPRTNENK